MIYSWLYQRICLYVNTNTIVSVRAVKKQFKSPINPNPSGGSRFIFLTNLRGFFFFFSINTAMERNSDRIVATGVNALKEMNRRVRRKVWKLKAPCGAYNGAWEAFTDDRPCLAITWVCEPRTKDLQFIRQNDEGGVGQRQAKLAGAMRVPGARN